MEPVDHKHEKVRFRRDEIVRLDDLPSACETPPVSCGPRPKGLLFVVGVAVAAVLTVLAIVPLTLIVFGVPAAGSERLRLEAEAVLTRLAGVDIDADIGEPRLSVVGTRLLAVQIDDVRVSGGADGSNILEAGTVRFGLRFLPLLGGDVQLGSAGIEDARLSLEALPARDGRRWLDVVGGPDGLADPDLIMREVFAALHRAFDGLDQGSTRRIDLVNVEIVFPTDLRAHSMRIERAEMSRDVSGVLHFAGAADVDGHAFTVKGRAERDLESRTIANLKVSATLEQTRIDRPLPEGVEVQQRQFAIVGMEGAVRFDISGSEAVAGAARLSVTGRLDNASVVFANGQTIAGSANMAARLDTAARKIEIEKLQVLAGRSQFNFHGAVGPAPEAAGRDPHYRFELVSDGSLIAPGGASEPDLPIIARLAGTIGPRFVRIGFDEIGVRSGPGEVIGKALITLEAGKTPGIDLALSVPEMPVGHVKQLWPWFGASGAQRWATDNLFGGMARNSTLSMSVPPGRIGNGVPLMAHEITGHFEVAGTRFDITGQIPPVRDGIGTVDFRGTDVDIALASGTVFLPSGRTVEAHDGTFTIRDGARQPVIGNLDIKVAGDAAAIADLASYKPIDAMRNLPFAADDLSGSVTGTVQAQIPLQKDVDIESLGWKVSLDYDGLAIAKPFEGQSVTAAKGSIEVEPTRALIKADARLNGMAAELDLVEPLGGSEVKRERRISVTLDDKSREALAPGLGTMLSGPVKVRLGDEGGSVNRITADLTQARLSLPWVGWSKGPGVPATLKLGFETNGGETRIRDAVLEGKSFSLRGDATVSGGKLTSAKISSIKLNRDDDARVEVRRAGGGYAIDIKASTLDVRPLIKQVMADPDGGASGAKGTPLTIEADIQRAIGFGGESLSGLKVSYRGTGSRIESLQASAATQSGGAVSAASAAEGGQRRVSAQSADAGALLRFLDVYPHMERGEIALKLAGQDGKPLRGGIEARNFALVNDPRLRSIVSTPPDGDGRSLNDAIRRDIDTSRAVFERGYAAIEKGDGYLKVDNGVVRGPLIGTTFQGTLYDASGKMAITGTFMPAYGLNRLFAEIPLVGQILGNGRDRGLIGITYKVAGDAKAPQVQVNPISAIAPGIFRSIFEFN